MKRRDFHKAMTAIAGFSLSGIVGEAVADEGDKIFAFAGVDWRPDNSKITVIDLAIQAHKNYIRTFQDIVESNHGAREYKNLLPVLKSHLEELELIVSIEGKPLKLNKKQLEYLNDLKDDALKDSNETLKKAGKLWTRRCQKQRAVQKYLQEKKT